MTDLGNSAPKATPLVTGHAPDTTVSVAAIRQDASGLHVQLESNTWCSTVIFRSAWGFRVLAELDLGEFWASLSLRDGWLFEVQSGGWQDLEKARPHFTSGRLYQLHEYLIVGTGNCVSVIAEQPPEIVGTPSNNSSKPTPLRGAA